MVSWVELPLVPRPACREDELGFIRPRDRAPFIEKGKYKATADSPVWHVDQSPADASPFYLSEEDLRDVEAESWHVVAVRPKASRGSATETKDQMAEASARQSQETDGRASVRMTQHGRIESSAATGAQVPSSQSHSDDLEETSLENSNPRSNGDRIAQAASQNRSGTSSPRATRDMPSSHEDRSATATQQERKSDAQKTDKDKSRVKDSEKSKHKSDEAKNLRSDLNEDAFARSAGARQKEEYRNKLAVLAQARKKAQIERGESVSSDDADGGPNKRRRLGNGKRATTVSSDSESSGSDDDSSDSDSSGTGSSSDGSKDFIVADDQIEYEPGFQPEEDEVPATTQTGPVPQALPPSTGRWYDRNSDGKIHLAPISHPAASSSSGSILAAHGLGSAAARKDLDEMCLNWIEWAAARVLLTWSALSQEDRKRLERNRAALRSRMRSVEESVGSVAMRRQFRWYLLQYPKMEVEALFSDEVDEYGTLAKNGCGVCHRRNQKAQFKITFSGLRYNQGTLGPLKEHDKTPNSTTNRGGSDSDSSSDDSDTSSDRSDANETWREQDTDERDRPTFTFFAGQHCAQRAAVLHKLHHWEWTTMQTLAKHDVIRFIRRLLWRTRKQGKGKDGKMGCGAWEVALAVNEMISPSGRCVWKGMEKKEGVRGKSSELERLRRRLKGLSEQAIEVNRAR